MTADLVIKGGVVVDGTGAPPRRADVAIADGRVVAVDDDLDGAEDVDAAGRIVAPGFVDIHTHYDTQVFWDPGLTSSCWHGVTSVIAGNCGRVRDVPGDEERLVADSPAGIEHVFVNGVAITSHGASRVHTMPERPGQLLRAGGGRA